MAEEAAELSQSSNHEIGFPLTSKVEPKKYFECADCGLHEEYDFYGKCPPFCKSIMFLEDSYVARDPFSSNSGNNANFLLLGSNCAVCNRMTCQECSTFFSKRLCAQCFQSASSQLPEELKAKKKAKD